MKVTAFPLLPGVAVAGAVVDAFEAELFCDVAPSESNPKLLLCDVAPPGVEPEFLCDVAPRGSNPMLLSDVTDEMMP